MITIDEALRLKEQLLALLDEDPANQERILDRLDSIRSERGIEAHSALMLILTGQSFDEETARRQWEAIVHHREAMSARGTGPLPTPEPRRDAPQVASWA